MSKVTLPDSAINQIRDALRACRVTLMINKDTRKELILKIRKAKEEVRRADIVLSCCQQSTVSEGQNCAFFMSNELMRKRVALTDLRQKLLLQEFHRDIELARYRILHQSLDKLRVPVYPDVYASKNGGKKTL